MEPTPALPKVLDGAVELRRHSGTGMFPRRFEHVEASRGGARINMRAILRRSHHHNTLMDLLATAPTPMHGGVALNSEVGGVTPSATAVAITTGGRCVWGLTVFAAQYISTHRHDDGFPSAVGNLHEEEVSISDDSGEVSERAYLFTAPLS